MLKLPTPAEDQKPYLKKVLNLSALREFQEQPPKVSDRLQTVKEIQVHFYRTRTKLVLNGVAK